MAISDESVNRMVLIVDDDKDFVAQLTMILLNEGYVVLSAGDGPAAIRIMETYQLKVDLAIVDLFLPGLNGFEVIGIMRRHQSALKIVAIS